MNDYDYGRYVDEEWDWAEAEMLEQVNLATGQPTVRLPGLFSKPKPEKQSEAQSEDSRPS